MGKCEDLSDFDKGQIVMARRLGQSISKTADLVGRSRYAVVSTYQKWSKEGHPVNRRQGHGRPRLIDAEEEQRLARLVQSHGRATVAQIAENLNAGHDRKVSEHTVHRSLLRMGLRRRRPVRVPMLTPVHRHKHQQWGCERQNGTMEQWKKTEVAKMGKDPKKQRGKMSSYAYFLQICREEYKKIHPDASVNFSEFSKKCSEQWKTMSAKEKAIFEELAKQDKVGYERGKNYVTPKGEKKRTKDPNAPKRPPSAFLIFCGDHRPKVKTENPGLSAGDIAKKLGEMWSSTSAEDKQPYEKKATKLKEKYDKDIAAYRDKGKPAPATVTEAKKKDQEEVFEEDQEKVYEEDQEKVYEEDQEKVYEEDQEEDYEEDQEKDYEEDQEEDYEEDQEKDYEEDQSENDDYE